jgi:regulator of RNase E activity RraB
MRSASGSKSTPYRLVAVAIIVVALAGVIALRAIADRGNALTAIRTIPNDPDIGDAAVISELKKAGSDLTREASVIHYLYLPSQEAAHEAAAALCRRGFTTAISEPENAAANTEPGGGWGVLALEKAIPSALHLRTVRRIFTALAEKYGGDYDGWEASIVNPKVQVPDEHAADLIKHADCVPNS